MIREALLSACGTYRYTLTRTWGDGPTLLFVMLNPSTADAMEDDATVRRCIAFAKRWGFGRIVIVNLMAYRATHPVELTGRSVAELRGPEYRKTLVDTLAALPVGSQAICAWGANPAAEPFEAHMLRILSAWGFPTYCLAVTKSGAPGHPLYLPSTSERKPYP